jgi:oligoendopeptidase F
MKALAPRQEVPREFTWNLEDMYATNECWEEDFARVTSLIPQLSAFAGTLSRDATTLLQALQLRDQIGEILERVLVYALMRRDEENTNSTAQAMADRAISLARRVATATAFIEPEILAIPQDRLAAFIQSEPGLTIYRHYLDEITRRRAHVRSAEIESLLAEAGEIGLTPSQIFRMLFDADLKLPLIHDADGHEVELTKGNYRQFLESPDRTVRREAFEEMHSTFRKQQNTLAATLAAQVKTNLFFARARGYPSARAAILDQTNIPVSVYDNLLTTVNRHLHLLHRYLRLRKRLLQLDELHMYDLYVPIIPDVDCHITFPEATRIVEQALSILGPDYTQALRNAFASRWIDVYENAGKTSGAYSWGAYGSHPFILLNYQDNLDSMFTLAHEMGHAMHSFYTWRTQPFIYSSYTIFVTEVASTLNEVLLTAHLLKEWTDPTLRRYLINHALESFRTTLYRQTLFAEFEHIIHLYAEQGGALTPEYLCTTFKELNERYYGPVSVIDDLVDIEWARIPHFYTSFYVYQYATGISAATALAQQILTEGQPAIARYRRFLEAGSSDYSINLLRDAGVDISSPEPIQQALNVFERYLDEMEQLI